MFVVRRISDTIFPGTIVGDVSDWFLFLRRFGSDFIPVQVQSNKIRSETLL